MDNQAEPILTASRDGGFLEIFDPFGEPLLEEAVFPGAGAIATASVDLRWWLLAAWWRFRRRVGPWRWVAPSPPVETGGLMSALLDDSGNSVVEVSESVRGATVDGEVRMPRGAQGDWIRWRLKAGHGEKFLGFGERFNAVDQSGNKLYVWTEEGAVGLGERWGRWLDGASFNPFANGPTTAYKPMPFFISRRGYGLLLDTFARVEYDVAATDSGAIDITVWDKSFRWTLFYGPGLAEIVERFTARVGRATVPTKWAFAPWNDEIFGSESVRECARKLRENKIPTTAMWTEDWQGGYWLPPFNKKKALYNIFPFRHSVARHLYPDLEAVARDLRASGFRWLSYFVPYLLRRSSDFREARDRGYLLKNKKGKPILVFIQWLSYGHIDLTNPEARDWFKGKLADNLALGFDGWMADFSEYVPPGAHTASGETGLEHHNRFPLLWQRMNREVMDEQRPDGDYVFFCRAAAVGSQKYAPVFWSGDSNTDFERYDGLPSNLPAAISAGLCGLPIWAADVGGYEVVTRGRDKELFMRWTEFAALLPVMRTHHGTHPNRCWSWDSDVETIEVFGRYCRLHTALFPYIYNLAHEAAERGLPAVRHLAMHHGEDPASWEIEDQFLLGDRLLVAPVIERNRRGRQVYFPPGEWIDYWTGDSHAGPGEQYAHSQLDHLPLFVRAGAIIPTLDLPVDTLVPVEPGAGLVGEEEALSTLRATQYGPGTDSYELSDGTVIEMWRSGEADARALANSRMIVRSGAEMALAPDALQSVAARSEPDRAITVRGACADIVAVNRDGNRLAAVTITGGPPRERLTFEWR